MRDLVSRSARIIVTVALLVGTAAASADKPAAPKSGKVSDSPAKPEGATVEPTIQKAAPINIPQAIQVRPDAVMPVEVLPQEQIVGPNLLRNLQTQRQQMQAEIARCGTSPNLSFERNYDCWIASGEAFDAPPAGGGIAAERVQAAMRLEAGGVGGDYWRDLTYPIGISGERWIGTCEGDRGDAATGSLTSVPFVIRAPYLSMQLGGGAVPDVYVALSVSLADLQRLGVRERHDAPPDADGFVEIGRLRNLENSDVMKRVWFDLPRVLRLGPTTVKENWSITARLTIVDDATGAFGHINVDDVRHEVDDPSTRTLRVRRAGHTLYFDRNAPVWGFADTHAHPAHHLGFGGRMIVGDPSQPLEQTYATSVHREHHGGAVRVMGGKNYMNLLGLADEHFAEGAPDYIGYPRFNVKLHQQHHPAFFKRAFDGGQRLMVALAVNNQFLATRALGPGIRPGFQVDDHTQMLQQVRFIRELVAANSGFMEIATSPAEARRIILENKMAVVLGLEVDNFSNFKDESFVWRDDPSNAAPLVALPRDVPAARPMLARAIDEYHRAGVRQVTALHYVNGLFGGVPIQQSEPLLISMAYTGTVPGLRDGRTDGVAFHIFEDVRISRFFLAPGDTAQFALRGVLGFGAEGMSSTVSAQGLTPRGQELMLGMMRRGMLIDTEHMSYQTKDDLFALARRFRYPLMSSHSDIASLAFRSPRGTRFGGSPEDRWREFGSTNIRNVAHEGQLLDRHLVAIRELGGTLGVIMLPYRKSDYRGSWGGAQVRNDIDGSSKTWAQSFLHAADQMGGRGVGLATDRGGVEAIGPRFGPYAAWPLREEELDFAKLSLRRTQRAAQAAPQAKGVRYDQPARSFHPWLWEFGVTDPVEEDMWKALAYIRAFPSLVPAGAAYDALPDEASKSPDRPWKIPSSSEAGHGERILSFVRGWHAPNEAALNHPGFANTSERPWEEAVFWLLGHERTPCELVTYGPDDIRHCAIGERVDAGPISRLYAKLAPLYRSWRNMDGDNAPLRRLVTGTRHWDFNTDGLAHYGLLPDFLQDLRNVGINQTQMDVLFRSAEDYIQMWERADEARARVPGP
jgi:microsomal dipeptidase-like Zn-dependent dipeptidase